MKVSKIVRVIFLKETVLLIAGLTFLWFSISIFVDSNFTKGGLKAHSGVIEQIDVVSIRVKNKPFFKEITKQLQLRLKGEDEVYTIETSANFDNITSKIKEGDDVTVFTKPKVWGIFGLKKASNICHLVNDKEVIINYASYRNSISGLIYLTLPSAVIFIIIYIIKLRHRLWWDLGGYKASKDLA